jgi:A/G-specific adenine glycosylase
MDINDIEKLRAWFISQARDLPWRKNPSPYAVWVSEVMLQQTQVSVVIPYFLRWMERFPTIESLAKTSVEEVLKQWEGLGYYSRARNLHEGARYILENYNGELPSTESELRKIKGLGPYTIGAIRGFAFRQKAAAVDGNVLRVLARYHCIQEDISKIKTVKQMQKLAHDFLPDQEPWVVSEALIELGATICTKTAKCFQCPLKDTCKAFAKGKVQELPVKSSQIPVTLLYRSVAVIVCDGRVLVGRGEKEKVMADLYEFPYIELKSNEIDVKSHKKQMESEWQLKLDWIKTLPNVKHSFTRYRALLIPQLFQIKHEKAVKGYEWHPFAALKTLPFSSGHRRILRDFEI